MIPYPIYMLTEIGLRAQKMITILSAKVNIICVCVCVCVEGGEELYDYLVFVEIFTLITKKIFI